MMFNVFFTLVLSIGVLSLLALVSAVYLPGQPAFRSVLLVPRGEESSFSPRILNPSHQTVWFKGVRQAVTCNPDCQVYLARWDTAKQEYSHVYHDHPLASHCKLRDGNTTLVIPQEDWVEPARDYVVILIGDLGDHSPLFTIADPPEIKPQ